LKEDREPRERGELRIKKNATGRDTEVKGKSSKHWETQLRVSGKRLGGTARGLLGEGELAL